MKQELLKNAGYCALDYQAESIRVFFRNSYITDNSFAPSHSIYMFFMAQKAYLWHRSPQILGKFQFRRQYFVFVRLAPARHHFPGSGIDPGGGRFTELLSPALAQIAGKP
jgi:hypothetical protein